jgi:hypothetical protein
LASKASRAGAKSRTEQDRFCGYFCGKTNRRLNNVPDLVVADAVAVKPVSTPKFPANREINREFCQIDPLCAISKADTQVNSKTCSKIPYATEQGINSAEQGIPAQQQGVLSAKSEIIIG